MLEKSTENLEDCGQAGGILTASRMPVHGVTCLGGLNLISDTGGSAKGIPSQEVTIISSLRMDFEPCRTPEVVLTVRPWVGPDMLCPLVGGEGGRSPKRWGRWEDSTRKNVTNILTGHSVSRHLKYKLSQIQYARVRQNAKLSSPSPNPLSQLTSLTIQDQV